MTKAPGEAFPTHGETFLDLAGLQAVAERLAGGATMLDRTTGADAPQVPDAGVSTGSIGDLLTAMAETLGDLVTAMELTAVSVRPGPLALDE